MDTVALGVEIGGTKLQLVLGNRRGELITRCRGQVEPTRGADGILEWLAQAAPAFLSANAEMPCDRIGVGFGGPVDSETGRVLVSHQVAGWEGIELKRWFEERFQLPVTVANDSNAAGWAEFCLGAGQGCRNFAYMNIGSGIGGALVLNGRLYDGQGRGAAEFGHTYVPDWTSPHPGAAVKLEQLCSGWAIERRLRRQGHYGPDPTCVVLGQRARHGDAAALTEIDNIARSIAVALANVVAMVHPEKVALGGGVALMGDVLLDAVRRHTDDLAFGPYKGRYEVVSCALQEDVVPTGAVLLSFAQV